MAKMSHAAMVLLLGAAALMVVQTSAQGAAVAHKKGGSSSTPKVVNCDEFCAGNDFASPFHKKKKSSSGTTTPTTLLPNTPDKCGLYQLGSGVITQGTGALGSTCDCGQCPFYGVVGTDATARLCSVTTGGAGKCCSCNLNGGSSCSCNGGVPSVSTFCSTNAQAAGSTCLNCREAVCCMAAFEYGAGGNTFPATFRYTGPSTTPVGSATGGQLDWSTAPAGGAGAIDLTTASPGMCSLGVYSCSGLGTFATRCAKYSM